MNNENNSENKNRKKNQKKILIFFILVIVILYYISVALTYNTKFKQTDNNEGVQQVLNQNENIVINIIDSKKIGTFFIFNGEDEANNHLVAVYKENPLYFKGYYKKIMINNIPKGDFSQQIKSGLFEYKILYSNHEYSIHRQLNIEMVFLYAFNLFILILIILYRRIMSK